MQANLLSCMYSNCELYILAQNSLGNSIFLKAFHITKSVQLFKLFVCLLLRCFFYEGIEFFS